MDKNIQNLVQAAAGGETNPDFAKALVNVLRNPAPEPAFTSRHLTERGQMVAERFYFSDENQQLVKDAHPSSMGLNDDGSSRLRMSEADGQTLAAMVRERRRWTPEERVGYPLPAEARNSVQGSLCWQLVLLRQDGIQSLLLITLIWSFVFWPNTMFGLLRSLWMVL